MSSKLTNLTDLAGGQVPTDLAYVVDVSAGASGSKKSTLNDLIEQITKNITDGVLKGINGSGTNVAGGNFDLSGGKGTGNAVPGQLAARYPLIGAGGTTLQSLSTDRFPVSVNLFTNTGSGDTISNTTTETSLFTGMTASAGSTRTIEAGVSRIGTVNRMRFKGRYAATGAPTGRFRLKLGATTIADTGAFTLQNTGDAIWSIDVDVEIRAIGAAGTARVSLLRAELGSGISGAQTLTVAYATAETGIDFSVNETIDLTFQFGAANVANVMFMSGVNLERLR